MNPKRDHEKKKKIVPKIEGKKKKNLITDGEKGCVRIYNHRFHSRKILWKFLFLFSISAHGCLHIDRENISGTLLKFSCEFSKKINFFSHHEKTMGTRIWLRTRQASELKIDSWGPRARLISSSSVHVTWRKIRGKDFGEGEGKVDNKEGVLSMNSRDSRDLTEMRRDAIDNAEMKEPPVKIVERGGELICIGKSLV
jgi:hypothetical protein